MPPSQRQRRNARLKPNCRSPGSRSAQIRHILCSSARVTRAFCLGLSILLLACVPRLQAVVLDWSGVAWTPGSLSNSYEADGFPANGNDLTIVISGNTNKLTIDPATGLASPSIASSLEGGTAGDHSLILAGDFEHATNFTVTVTFTGPFNGATDVSFTLFDIDLGTDHEKIVSIYGLLSDGITQVAPMITNLGSAVTLSGTGLSQVLTGDAAVTNTGVGSGNGNATISFGSTAIRSFTFDFKNDGGPPRFQSIGLFDIAFTPVPELNPSLIAGADVCSPRLACSGAADALQDHRFVREAHTLAARALL